MFRVQEVRKKVTEITGYARLSESYLLQAFTRSSVNCGESNEIFELMGDAVLACYALQLVHDRLGIFRDEDSVNYKGNTGYALRGIRNEAQLDMLKKKLVCNETLARQIDKWELAQYIQMGKTDKINHVEEQTKTKADLFEAILGAIAVSCNFDSDTLKGVTDRMLPIDEIIAEVEENLPRPVVEFNIENSITVLKELAEQGFCSMPVYESFGPENIGSFSNGDPMWCCTCRIGSRGFSEAVFANSLKTAKKCVSYIALCRFFEVTNEIAQYSSSHNRFIVKRGDKYEIITDKRFR